MKKVLLYFPDALDESIQSLPSIDLLLANEEDGVHFDILGKADIESLITNFYPGVRFHKLPEENMNVFDIHKYAVNQNDIFNIDSFLDFEGSFKSAFMGYSFKPRQRVGFKGGMKTFLYNKPLEPIMESKQGQIVKLMQSMRPDLKVDLKKVVDFKEWDKESPFVSEGLKELTDIVIAVARIADLEPWKDFLEDLFMEFEGRKIRFLFWDDKKENAGEMVQWYEGLNKDNHYYFDFYDSYLDVISLSKNTKMFLTTEPWMGTLACILALNPVIMTSAGTKDSLPFYVGQKKYLVPGKRDSNCFYDGESLTMPQLVDRLAEDYTF